MGDVCSKRKYPGAIFLESEYPNIMNSQNIQHRRSSLSRAQLEGCLAGWVGISERATYSDEILPHRRRGPTVCACTLHAG